MLKSRILKFSELFIKFSLYITQSPPTSYLRPVKKIKKIINKKYNISLKLLCIFLLYVIKKIDDIDNCIKK